MKCILHIGTEKTGTTSLQYFLSLNRPTLLDRGFLYTISAGKNNNRSLAAMAYNSDRRDDFTKRHGIHNDSELKSFQAEVFSNLLDELDNHSGVHTVIFSSEHIQSRLTTIEEVFRLKILLDRLGFSEISILVYLRNPIEIANSLYTTAVRSGSTVRQPPNPDNLYWRNICDHKTTLVRFRNVFGKNAVIPRIYCPTELLNGSIIDDFADAIELAFPQRNFTIPERQNSGMTHIGLEILRRVNDEIPAFREDGTPNPMREGIQSCFSEHMTLGGKYGMSTELRRQYEDAFEESNEWVRAEYFPDRDQLFDRARVPPPVENGLDSIQLDQIASLISTIWIDHHSSLDDAGHSGRKATKPLRQSVKKIKNRIRDRWIKSYHP